jgi:DNA sulfur modification protein DndD
VLGVPALINCRNEIQALLKKARANQLRDTRANEKFQMLNDEMARLDNELEGLEKDKANLGNQEAQYKKKIGKLDDELSDSEGVLTFKGNLVALEAEQKSRLDREKELNKTKLDVIGNAWKDLLQPRLKSKINQLEKERDSYKQKIQRQGEFQERVRIIKETIRKSRCSVCLGDIDDDRRKKLGSELGRIEGELESLLRENERLGEVTAEISRLSRIRTTGAAETIKGIEKNLNENNVRLTEIENKIEEIGKKIRGYDTAELARKRSLKDQYLREVGKISASIQDIENRIRKNNDRQNQIAAIISRDPVSKQTRSSIQVEILNNLAVIFGEAVDRLRDTLRLRVAEYASDAFKELITEKTYKKLEINENYGLLIIDKNGQEVRERSAGAEQIVALSLIDGLNRTARKTGPIIMDTPLGRLDPNHRKNLISYMPKMADQVVMLVHEGEISKKEVMSTLAGRIAGVFEIERITSSQSRIVSL